MSALKLKLTFSKIELVQAWQRRQPGAETTEIEAHMKTYFWFVLLQIINAGLLTGSTNFWHDGG